MGKSRTKNLENLSSKSKDLNKSIAPVALIDFLFVCALMQQYCMIKVLLVKKLKWISKLPYFYGLRANRCERYTLIVPCLT